MPNQHNDFNENNKTDFGIGIALVNTMLALTNLELNNASIAKQNNILDVLNSINVRLEKIEVKINE